MSDQKKYQKLRIEIDGGVATIFLTNPPMNVMTLGMRRELDEALTSLEADPAIGAVVLQGTVNALSEQAPTYMNFQDLWRMVPSCLPSSVLRT